VRVTHYVGLAASGIALLAAVACGSSGQSSLIPAEQARVVSSAPSSPVTEAHSIALVEQFYKVIFDEHKLNLASDFIRLDYIQHTPSVPSGVFGFQYFYSQVFFKKFPDMRATIDHIIASNDRVQTCATWRGHEAGTGKPIVLHTADIYRIEGGKLAEHWDTIDYSSLEPFGFTLPQTDEPSSPVITDGTPAAANNVALLERFWQTVFDKHIVADVPDFYSTASFHEYITPMCPSVAAFEACFTKYSTVFPDLHVTPTQIIANSDWVVTFLTWRGHEAGTSKVLFLHCADLYRVQNGRFTQHWSIMDFSTIEQFGIVPPASYLQ